MQKEVAKFKEINQLNINDRLCQCILLSIHEFFGGESPEYFNEVYFSAEPSKTMPNKFLVCVDGHIYVFIGIFVTSISFKLSTFLFDLHFIAFSPF